MNLFGTNVAIITWPWVLETSTKLEVDLPTGLGDKELIKWVSLVSMRLSLADPGAKTTAGELAAWVSDVYRMLR